jgi:hypothetical protein
MYTHVSKCKNDKVKVKKKKMIASNLVRFPYRNVSHDMHKSTHK